MTNDARILDLLKQLEAEGVRIAPRLKGQSVSDLKKTLTPGSTIEQRLKQLGPGARADDWWVEGSWKMSF